MRKLIAIITLAISGNAAAVCPNPEPRICSQYFDEEAVFVGVCVSATEVRESGDGELIAGWKYLLKVERRFRGKKAKYVKAYSGNDSDRFPLEVGHKYLLFASRNQPPKDELYLGFCGNNRDVTGNQDGYPDVEAVIAANKAGKPGNIRGSVGAPGVTVFIDGPRDKYRTVTDSDGWFSIDVKAGTYKVVPQALPGTRIRLVETTYDMPSAVKVESGGGGEVAFSVEKAEWKQ